MADLLLLISLVSLVSSTNMTNKHVKNSIKANLMVKVLDCWIINPEVPSSKLLGGSKVDSTCHPSDIEQMNIKNF